ncbi:MAG: glycosyltransferase family 2 protein [bacterium]|nr:glycosyltransferase family 2 protein [bacterium]
MNSRTRTYRLLEMVPGFLLWGTFIGALVFSFFQPLWVIYFIILFDLLWLYRVVYFLIFLLYGWRKFMSALRVDWFDTLTKDNKKWKNIYHLLFLPMSKEEEEIVDTTLQSILRSHYSMERFIVVLAGEARAQEHFEKIAEKMKKKYGPKFFKFIVTLHPDNVAGEMASKGANINYAGKHVKKVIDTLNIPYEDIIVSTFDIDTNPHPQYFAALTHAYLHHPHPTRTSYQPVVLYNNNIWESSAPMRLAAFGTTFWLLSELARPDRLFTFSSHSMSFKALVDVGFWQNDIVSEDSRIFLQCFLRYHGDYSVTPIYVPVNMDTVQARTQWASLVNLYKQQRRWAWGVEHFPFMVTRFWHDNLIPLKKRIKYLWIQLEGMYTWATAPILIFALGRLPLYFAHGEVSQTALAQNAPFILENLLNLTLVGVIVIAILTIIALPPRPKTHSAHKMIYMIAQWILLPITLIVLSSLPAIDAQTRMFFGRYLGFWVTEKARK